MATEAAPTKYAVVTGGNKGIGLEICRQLAFQGVTVVLTARDQRRGLQAVEELRRQEERHGGAAPGHLLFHQLDVADTASIATLADFIKTHFGRLDILVNNAGISGVMADFDAWKTQLKAAGDDDFNKIDLEGTVRQTYELAEECIRVNYYGAKRMIHAFIPLLCLSKSARIVNVSSSLGKLKNLPNEWAKGVLSDGESLTEERIDTVLSSFLKDFKDGQLTPKNWPPTLSAYITSKAAMTAYTRIVAKNHPNWRVNCVCPGFVKTEMTGNEGKLRAEEGAESPVWLALLPDDGPSGRFFDRKEVSPF